MSDFGQGGGGGFGQPPQSGGGFGQPQQQGGGGGFGQPPQAGGFGQPPQGGGFGPGGGGGGALKPHRGPLVLGLGIFGFCCLLTGLAAIILGRGDLKAIEAGEMDPEGKTFTQVGFWCGVVSVALSAVFICLYGVLSIASFL